ncbi:MAG: hypothetical protein MJK04_03985 [Psychrosphaera sp.]|nr:hypothetical protein [Psychrosphaera sp.]
METYQIIDEPKPGPLSKFTVNPLWPLLSTMLGGSVFSWIWFVFNSMCLNGPNKIKELLTILVGFFAFVGVYHFGVNLFNQGVFGDINVQYFFLFGTCVQLVFSYAVFMLQSDGFEVYQYYGGTVATPLFGLFLALMFGSKLQLFILQMIWGAG